MFHGSLLFGFVMYKVCEDRGYNTIKHCDKTAKTKSTTVDCFSVLTLLQLLPSLQQPCDKTSLCGHGDGRGSVIKVLIEY